MDKFDLCTAASCISMAYIKTGFCYKKEVTNETIDVAIEKYYESGRVPWVVFLYYAKVFPEANPNKITFRYKKPKKYKKRNKE